MQNNSNVPLQKDYENPRPNQQPGIRPQKFTTLNESVLQSLLRDIKQIFIRIRYVVFPFGSGTKRLKNWDLWGPLVLCICLSWTLSAGAPSIAANDIFGTVFCLIWVGASIVTLNAQILGGDVSIFHSVCTLCYSLFPLNIAAAVCVFMKAQLNFSISLIITVVAFLWSFKAASIYMEGLMGSDMKGLALYPVFLFYLFLAFFILQMVAS